jgi:hypothetical protein
MLNLFATGRIVDLILAFTAIEAALLVAWHRRSGRGPAPADLLSNLMSGVCLMLALRGALVGAWWGWIAAGLLAALVAHLFDLQRRWRL